MIVLGMILVISAGMTGAPPTTSQDHGEKSRREVTSRPSAAPKVTDTCRVLESAAEAADDPVERTRAWLVAARCRLVRECAGPLSAELCWSAKPDPELGDIVRRAMRCLDSAETAMKEWPESVEEKVRRDLGDRLDMLRAFAGLFAAMADLKADSEDSRSRLIEACIAVSMYLDDPNRGVAESAKLWQGVAYRRAGRAERTLQLLWPAIGDLSSNRVDFFARVERCRSLTDKGQYVAALALAVKLEEHLDDCMKGEDAGARELAEESLRWVRVFIHRRWAEELRREGKEQRAQSAEAAAAKLLGDATFPPPRERWLQLTETIVGLPDWESPAAAAPEDKADKP